MTICAGCGIITRMDISVLSTTNDIEQLRTLALAMVQNVVSENAEKEEKLRQQNISLQQHILLLEEALKLARQQRFGKRAKHWPVCNAPCSKRIWMRISLRLKRNWTRCFLLKKNQLRNVRHENRYRPISRVSQKLSNRPQPKAVLTARAHCVTSAMR